MYFSVRSDADELMDDPKLDRESLGKAYLDINRCKRITWWDGNFSKNCGKPCSKVSP